VKILLDENLPQKLVAALRLEEGAQPDTAPGEQQKSGVV
jgi:hypothetical protein